MAWCNTVDRVYYYCLKGLATFNSVIVWAPFHQKRNTHSHKHPHNPFNTTLHLLLFFMHTSFSLAHSKYVPSFVQNYPSYPEHKPAMNGCANQVEQTGKIEKIMLFPSTKQQIMLALCGVYYHYLLQLFFCKNKMYYGVKIKL